MDKQWRKMKKLEKTFHGKNKKSGENCRKNGR